MNIITICCETQTFHVSNEDIIQLELKLNLTDKAQEYSKVGDHLYNFYTKEGCEGQPSNVLHVEQVIYDFLQHLHHTSYQEVWDKKYN